MDKELLKPVDTVEEKWRLLPSFLKVRGVVNQHIASYNHFVTVGLKSMLKANAVVRSEADPKFFLEYVNIYVGQPNAEEQDMVQRQVSPHECRLRDLTYAAPVYVDVKYTRGDTVVLRRKVEVGRLPIMLRSTLCVLTGKSPAQMIALQECPHDPGGYFVIKGTERVVLSQEQLSKNRIILELDPKGDVSASVTSSTAMRKSRTVIHLKNNYLHMKHNTVGDDVPIVVVFKAMGIVSDQEIVSLIGAEDGFQEYIVAALEEASALGIFTQAQALDYLGSLIKAKRLAGSSSSLSRTDEARNILTDVVLVHVPVVAFNFKLKATYMAHMVRRILLCATGVLELDDKDYYGNKRLELAGQSIALLFEDSFKRFNGELSRQADNVLSKPSRASSFDVVKHVRPDIITNAMVQAIATGNWSLKRFKMEQAGMTQQVTRHSYLSAMGLMARVQSQFEKTRKAAGPRALQPSQWGMLCPSDTPEGEACGLAKSLALLTHVTTDEEPAPVHRLCFDLGMEDIEMLAGEEINAGNFLVFLNGLLVGAHRRPHEFARRMRLLRRLGIIGEFVSVYLHEDQHSVHISTDGGRVCRPLIIVDPVTRQPRITQEHISQVRAGLRDFNSFLVDNCIEYVDVSEENNCLVAL
ncbi:POLR3B, partial [Symbiodinium sp. KB8]